MKNNRFYLINLFDKYQNLLTLKQKQYFELYYFEDQSLSEIAEYLNVSKTAVQLAIKTIENELIKYEDKLELYKLSQQRLKYYHDINQQDLKQKLVDLEKGILNDEK